MRLVPLAPALLTLLAFPSVAAADGVAVTQNVFSDNGDPVVVANYVPDGSQATPTWTRCAPDCGETVATTQQYAAGDTAAGTTFEATTVVGGVTTTARSKTWTGRVTNTSLPTIGGDPRVGGTVTATAGTWTGGWGDERSELRIRLCKSPEPGRACVTLAPGPASAVLDSAYAGWYVGAIDYRYARDSVFPAGAWPAPVPGIPSTIPAPTPSRIVVNSALIGPITPAQPPSVSEEDGGLRPQTDPKPLGFTPKVTVLKTAKKAKGARTLGSITCTGTCVATVTYAQGKKTATSQLTITGKKALKLPSKLSVKKSTRVTVVFLRSTVTKTGTVKPA
ncbi:MAG: hypothetical protein Q7T55_06745 [Solirubrobacteraceae bacterium]|nr:hypothetical protein [Solirubrobacteraceae bacterium]